MNGLASLQQQLAQWQAEADNLRGHIGAAVSHAVQVGRVRGQGRPLNRLTGRPARPQASSPPPRRGGPSHPRPWAILRRSSRRCPRSPRRAATVRAARARAPPRPVPRPRPCAAPRPRPAGPRPPPASAGRAVPAWGARRCDERTAAAAGCRGPAPSARARQRPHRAARAHTARNTRAKQTQSRCCASAATRCARSSAPRPARTRSRLRCGHARTLPCARCGRAPASWRGAPAGANATRPARGLRAGHRGRRACRGAGERAL